MKTPTQLADEEITSRFGLRPALMDPTVAITTSTLREMIESAVIADRADRLPERTERGFARMEFEFSDYRGTRPRTFSVQESSLATEHKVWVGPDTLLIGEGTGAFESTRAHLNVDEARQVRDALSAWIESVES